MKRDPFEEYLKESEPDKANKGYAWSTAIGLQAVDGLKTSEYLIDTAIQNIEGKITMREAQELINSYYEERPAHFSDEERTEEADKVSSRIAGLLSETAFSFSPNEYISIHRKLFMGIYSHAGKIRDYNITKKEWVLDGATVMYGSASELIATLEYDFSQEKAFSYKGLSMEEIIHHLAVFISRLWQIHIFEEGNTRTTAVFFIKYLRMLGFTATNDIFAENAWYFRNALVRANYTNLQKGIYETTEYLEAFLRNLLLGERNELHNRNLHISGVLNIGKVDIGDEKVDIEDEKVDIGDEKVDIGDEKVDIGDEKVDIEDGKVDIGDGKAEVGCESGYMGGPNAEIEKLFLEKGIAFSAKTTGHILRLFEVVGYDRIFNKTVVKELIGLKDSGASKFLSKLVHADVIGTVPGYGKGKYRFKK
ncbi:Fic family protein [Blautia massiliensis (ex Durand et al. 2017)]|uniref:Fic family protein n=1 Tax=Blautia massiliensis (ex Durand et al. 2017) TaxID=1737424 RepID=UPI0022E38DCB|nr:Fic family protein [Blautia massiliensis (ex Durand et al. 2017)]